MKRICLKKVSISDISDLRGYFLFIVDSYSEFRIYSKNNFFDVYKDLDTIKNLYCINQDEELRLNNDNWVKIFESDTDGFEVLEIEPKSFIEFDNNSLSVYKYYIKSESIEKKNFVYIKNNPIIFRHFINDKQRVK